MNYIRIRLNATGKFYSTELLTRIAETTFQFLASMDDSTIQQKRYGDVASVLEFFIKENLSQMISFRGRMRTYENLITRQVSSRSNRRERIATRHWRVPRKTVRGKITNSFFFPPSVRDVIFDAPTASVDRQR